MTDLDDHLARVQRGTNLTSPILEAEARALFEADPSSKIEVPWDYLAPYKRADWIRIAGIRRSRLDLTEATAAAMWSAVIGRTWDDCPYKDTWRKRASKVIAAQKSLDTNSPTP